MYVGQDSRLRLPRRGAGRRPVGLGSERCHIVLSRNDQLQPVGFPYRVERDAVLQSTMSGEEGLANRPAGETGQGPGDTGSVHWL